MAKRNLIDVMLGEQMMLRAKKRMQLPVANRKFSEEEIEAIWEEFLQKRDSIYESMVEGTWKPAPATVRQVVKEGAKLRSVYVPQPLDRLIIEAAFETLHKALRPYNPSSVHEYENGKGVRKAHNKALRYLNSGHDWVVQIDVRNCSESLDRRAVLNALEYILRDRRALEVYRQCMMLTDQPEFDPKKEPVGIHPSTELVNLFVHAALIELDEMLLEAKVPYIRFNDDMMLFLDTAQQAKAWLKIVQMFLNDTLDLELNPKKTAIQHGLYGPFLGGIYAWKAKKETYVCRPMRIFEDWTCIAGRHPLLKGEDPDKSYTKIITRKPVSVSGEKKPKRDRKKKKEKERKGESPKDKSETSKTKKKAARRRKPGSKKKKNRPGVKLPV